MVTGVTGIAGGGLESCTTEISAVKVSLSGLNLCFVDTPGFDDTNKSDLNIFKMISEWIISTYVTLNVVFALSVSTYSWLVTKGEFVWLVCYIFIEYPTIGWLERH